MKWKLFAILVFLASNPTFTQNFEVEGQIKVTDLPAGNLNDSVLVRLQNGFIGIISLGDVTSDIKQIIYEDLLAAGLHGLVKDREGNTYRTKKIGSQIWMADNLKSTMYNDGTPIPWVTDSLAPNGWRSLETPAYTWYDNSFDSLGVKYGALYNYYTVSDTNSRNICPEGWHVPSDADWNVLVSYLDEMADTSESLVQSMVSSPKIMEPGCLHWLDSQGTNETGFSARGAGLRRSDGVFIWLKIYANFWSSSNESENAIGRRIGYLQTSIKRDLSDKKTGASVRCLRNP